MHFSLLGSVIAGSQDGPADTELQDITQTMTCAPRRVFRCLPVFSGSELLPGLLFFMFLSSPGSVPGCSVKQK